MDTDTALMEKSFGNLILLRVSRQIRAEAWDVLCSAYLAWGELWQRRCQQRLVLVVMHYNMMSHILDENLRLLLYRACGESGRVQVNLDRCELLSSRSTFKFMLQELILASPNHSRRRPGVASATL